MYRKLEPPIVQFEVKIYFEVRLYETGILAEFLVLYK